MKKSILLCILLFFLPHYLVSQKHRKGEVDSALIYRMEIQAKKKKSKTLLFPYKYEGSTTTYFHYKPYPYVKESEISFSSEKTYRLSFSTQGVKSPNIALKIYNKPRGAKARVLLFEKQNIGNVDFSFETDSLISTLIKTYEKKKVDPYFIENLNLKKLYFDYIIPASEDRSLKTDYLSKGVVILSVGYLNM